MELADSHAALIRSRVLTRLEHLAGAIASGDARAALELAARLESVRGDCACWLRAALLEASGRFEEAAGALRFLREKTAGEERAMVMLASARNLFAAGHSGSGLVSAGGSLQIERLAAHPAQCRPFAGASAQEGGSRPFAGAAGSRCLSSTTIDFLAPILRAQCFGAGIDAEIYIGPFNQIEQEIRDPDSGLARFRPDVIAIATDWRSLGLRDEEDRPPMKSSASMSPGWNRYGGKRGERLGAAVIQFNYEAPPFEALGHLSAALPGGRGRLLRALNLALWEAAGRTQGVAILDVDQIAARFGKDRWNDPVLWHTAKQYPSAEAMPALGHQFTAIAARHPGPHVQVPRRWIWTACFGAA